MKIWNGPNWKKYNWKFKKLDQSRLNILTENFKSGMVQIEKIHLKIMNLDQSRFQIWSLHFHVEVVGGC